jgi:N6-adenosine-specific RNA methylase IME4
MRAKKAESAAIPTATLPLLDLLPEEIRAQALRREYQKGNSTASRAEIAATSITTRSSTEACLLAKRKSLPVVCDHSVDQFLETRVREHSRKPVEARELFERLFGDIPRLELFARERFPGWDAVGDQLGKFTDGGKS